MSHIRPSTQIKQDGATTGQALVWDGSAWVPTSVGFGLLAAVSATGNAAWVTSTSTTYGDVDATNAQITFAAPSSGNVVVTAQAIGYSASTTNLEWALRTLSGTIVAEQVVCQGGSASDWVRLRAEFLVTGLTPGTSYTYKLSLRTPTAGQTVATYGGDTADPVVLTVIPVL